MNAQWLLYALSLAIAGHVYCWIKILRFLRLHNVKINFLLLKVFIIKYVNQYKAITTAENGRPGPYFGAWILSINLIWIFAVSYIIIR